MKEVIIKFEPFIFKQTVFIKDGDKILREEVSQKDLANFVSLLEGIDKVHLFGNEKFAEKIKEECVTKYKTNNIDFCINK